MSDMVLFMAAPFAACLLLLGAGGYLGLHVLRREIIFIDIAMAQIASLGATTALVLRIDTHGAIAYFFALAATAVAAIIFSLTRYSSHKVPQEAVIGVTYAVATMTALLLVDKAAGAHEHLREMLAGSILWVQWHEVGKCAAVLLLVGIFHWLFRDRFSLLSRDYEQARSSGMRVRLWDFLFYFSFGLIMVHAVRIGGILLVFAFLIIPASISALLARSWAIRIVIAWAVGLAVSTAGLVLSWKLDILCGPLVVCLLGLALVAIGLFRGTALRLRILEED